MRFIGLLLALLLVAFLINKQLGSGDPNNRTDALLQEQDPGAPKVPTNPGEVEQFGEDMQQYLDEQAQKRADAIRELEEG